MKLFTRDEAEALLPELRGHIAEMQRCKAQIDALRDELGEAAGKSAGNGHVRDEPALAEKRRRAESLVEQLNERLGEINRLGVELKSIDEGLLDFPADREGRVVYLCWRLGEERIGWWHEVDAGFAGRQPI